MPDIDELRPELRPINLLEGLLRESAECWEKYVANIALILDGEVMTDEQAGALLIFLSEAR